MSAAIDSTTIPNQLLGDWISRLSGSELKVMLYLTLRTGCFAGTESPDLALRQIADETNLSKKEVRNALRLLSINARFSGHFAPAACSSPYDSPPLPLKKVSARSQAC